VFGLPTDTDLTFLHSEELVLQLEFASGAVLTVYDDSDEYESFTINHQNVLIVV